MFIIASLHRQFSASGLQQDVRQGIDQSSRILLRWRLSRTIRARLRQRHLCTNLLPLIGRNALCSSPPVPSERHKNRELVEPLLMLESRAAWPRSSLRQTSSSAAHGKHLAAHPCTCTSNPCRVGMGHTPAFAEQRIPSIRDRRKTRWRSCLWQQDPAPCPLFPHSKELSDQSKYRLGRYQADNPTKRFIWAHALDVTSARNPINLCMVST